MRLVDNWIDGRGLLWLLICVYICDPYFGSCLLIEVVIQSGGFVSVTLSLILVPSSSSILVPSCWLSSQFICRYNFGFAH